MQRFIIGNIQSNLCHTSAKNYLKLTSLTQQNSTILFMDAQDIVLNYCHFILPYFKAHLSILNENKDFWEVIECNFKSCQPERNLVVVLGNSHKYFLMCALF